MHTAFAKLTTMSSTNATMLASYFNNKEGGSIKATHQINTQRLIENTINRVMMVLVSE